MNLRDLVPIKSMANGKAASQYSNSPKRRKNANNPQATSALQQVLFSPMSCALVRAHICVESCLLGLIRFKNEVAFNVETTETF